MSDMASEWARYAVVTYLALRLGEGSQFGKKALQKVVYLLQEGKRVPLGFRYTFYTYGVFSAELASTVDVVQSMHGIQAQFVANENAYYIGVGDKAQEILAQAKVFLEKYDHELSEIVEFAKGKSGKTLELISTIAFVTQAAEFRGADAEEKLVERVYELKPKFDKLTIRRELAELRKTGDFLPN